MVPYCVPVTGGRWEVPLASMTIAGGESGPANTFICQKVEGLAFKVFSTSRKIGAIMNASTEFFLQLLVYVHLLRKDTGLFFFFFTER